MQGSFRFRLPIALLVGSLTCLLLTVLMLSPQDLMRVSGLTGILLVFLLLYIAATSAWFLLLDIVQRLSSRYKILVRLHRSPRQHYYISSILGVIPIALLLMQSQGGVSVWDVALLVALIVILVVYVLKRA